MTSRFLAMMACLCSVAAFAQEELPVPDPGSGAIPEVNPQAAGTQTFPENDGDIPAAAEIEVTPGASQTPAPQISRPKPSSSGPSLGGGTRKRKKWVYVDDDYKWSAFFKLGLSLSPSTSATVNGGTATETKGSTSVNFGFEGNYRFNPYFQAAAMLEISRFSYPSAASSSSSTSTTSTTTTADRNSDSQLAFMIMPRGQYETYRAVFWGGLGLGLMRTSLGTEISGYSTSATGFVISPRIGADFETGTKITPGVELAYVSARGSFGPTTDSSSSSSSTTSSSVDISRHWLTITGRIGYRF